MSKAEAPAIFRNYRPRGTGKRSGCSSRIAGAELRLFVTLNRLFAEDTRLAVLASVAVAGAVLQALRPHHGLRDLPSASRAQYRSVVSVSVVSAVSWCLCRHVSQCSALVPPCSTSPFRSVRVRYESYYVSLVLSCSL